MFFIVFLLALTNLFIAIVLYIQLQSIVDCLLDLEKHYIKSLRRKGKK